jgi:tetratricopeptide (TPR) repeat protein
MRKVKAAFAPSRFRLETDAITKMFCATLARRRYPRHHSVMHIGLAVLVALLPTVAVATTAEKPAADASTQAPDQPVSNDTVLNDLYDKLAVAKSPEEANALAGAIDRARLCSGSDTIDLLMSRALSASQAGDNALAIELLSTIIRLRPQFTEAWNKRATLLFMDDNDTRSMADIAETLKREPRHYGAWAGLGMILMHRGDKKRAYDAFKRALAINPFLDDIKKSVDQMQVDVEGQGI